MFRTIGDGPSPWKSLLPPESPRLVEPSGEPSSVLMMAHSPPVRRENASGQVRVPFGAMANVHIVASCLGRSCGWPPLRSAL